MEHFAWRDAEYYDLCHGPYALNRRRRQIFHKRLNALEKALLFVLNGDLYNLKRKKVLDVGAGTANFSLALSIWGADVTALDLNPEFAKIADEKLRRFGGRGIEGDAADMPFDDNEFDLIVTVNFIDGGDFPEEKMVKAIKEMMRVSKPGSYFINLIRNGDHFYMRSKRGIYAVGKEKVLQLHNLTGLSLIKMGTFVIPPPWAGLKGFLGSVVQYTPLSIFRGGIYFISKNDKV